MTGEAAPSPVVSAARACACERRAPLPPGGRWFEVRNGDVAVPVRARRRDDQCDEGPLPPGGRWFEERNRDVLRARAGTQRLDDQRDGEAAPSPVVSAARACA